MSQVRKISPIATSKGKSVVLAYGSSVLIYILGGRSGGVDEILPALTEVHACRLRRQRLPITDAPGSQEVGGTVVLEAPKPIRGSGSFGLLPLVALFGNGLFPGATRSEGFM